LERTPGPPAAEAKALHALTPVHPPGGTTDLSSAIYGSLLVTTLLAVQNQAGASPQFVALTLVIGVGVFWLTEVWSELINHRVRGPITRGQTLRIARDESPMLTAAVIPALLLATAELGLATVDQALSLALLAAVVQLFVWGLAVGRALRRGWLPAIVVALVDLGLGLLIVVLKVAVLH
jgi:hypothetical protein